MAEKKAEPEPGETTATPPKYSHNEMVEMLALAREADGIDFLIRLYEDPDGSSKKNEYVAEWKNEELYLADIAELFGAGRYRTYFSYRMESKNITTNTGFIISEKFARILEKEKVKEETGERMFSITDMRGMVALLKEFSDVVIAHHPPGTLDLQHAQGDMTQQAYKMMQDTLKIQQDQQKQTFQIVMDQQKIREKAISQTQEFLYREEEDDEMDDEPTGTQNAPTVQKPATEELVDETFKMFADWLPSIINKAAEAPVLVSIAKAHPIFNQILGDPQAPVLLIKKIWESFGREEAITVLNSFGLDTGIIDAAAALIGNIGKGAL